MRIYVLWFLLLVLALDLLFLTPFTSDARLVFLLQVPDFYVLKEDTSPCIFGSIEKQRWSYACAKQLIERLVYGMLFFFSMKSKFNVR